METRDEGNPHLKLFHHRPRQRIPRRRGVGVVFEDHLDALGTLLCRLVKVTQSTKLGLREGLLLFVEVSSSAPLLEQSLAYTEYVHANRLEQLDLLVLELHPLHRVPPASRQRQRTLSLRNREVELILQPRDGLGSPHRFKQ